MIKIAYIELDTHAEIALNFMELIHDSKAFSVDYYFSEKILRSFGYAQDDQLPENIKKVTPQNLISQINVMLSEVEASNLKYDLVVIGTVHRYFNTFEKIAEKFNTAVICHNLNFVKASKLDVLTSIFKENFQYRLKLLLKEGLLMKSKVYQKAKHLLVLDETLRRENYKTLPVFYTKFSNHPENDVFTIVIPGAVSQKRRDYERVLKTIRLFKFPLEIVFLGKAQGRELEMLKHVEDPSTPIRMTNIKIKYFTEKVSQKEFDEYMQKADILWCPIQQETAFFSQKEIYGKTKMSGNIGDAIKFGKLAIFPSNYPSEYNFIIPEKENVWEVNFNAEKADFSKFSKEKVLQKLEKTLTELL